MMPDREDPPKKQRKNGKINKVEIPVGRVGDSTLEIEYSIEVRNEGEIEGETEVIERLPKYFKVASGTSKEWKEEKDGTLRLTTKLQPGETKEYTVVLKWERGESNFGSLVNTVELDNITNPANFEETTKEDMDYVVDNIKEIVTKLRTMSPLYEDFVKKNN